MENHRGARTIIYSRDNCSYCTKAKELFATHGIQYEENKLDNIKELREKFQEFALVPKSFPQIFYKGTYIGGYTNLRDRLEEPLLVDNPDRFVVFPIKYQDMFEMYKKAVASFWTVEEVDFSKDISDWEKMTEDERKFVKNILAFFASSDGIVMENLMGNFCKEVQVPEARQFYAFQTFIESVHSEMYSLLIDTYVKDTAERDHLFHAVQTIPAVKGKAEWAMKWLDPTRSFGERLVAFVAVEGLLFSSSFCSIFYLKQRNLLPALAFSNDLIARDEAMHQSFGELLFSHIKNKPTKKVVQDIIKDAVAIEQSFTRDSISCALIGMNSDLMCQYVEYIGDRISTNLGYGKIYKSENPFDFMTSWGLDGKSNFFEKRESSYRRARVLQTEDDKKFELTTDF